MDNKMYINTDTKLTILNTLVVGVSLTNLEMALKLSLLSVSIIYTIYAIREKILSIKKLKNDGSDKFDKNKNTSS
jgi:hypothetical protein